MTVNCGKMLPEMTDTPATPPEFVLDDASISAEPVIIQPSSAELARIHTQQERQKALKKFNRLYLYLPLALATGILLGFFILLIWSALFSHDSIAQNQASGISDIFITLFCLFPLVLVGLIFPAAGGYALYWRRQKGSLVRKHVTKLAGKAEGGLDSAEHKIREQQPRIVDGTIKARQKFDGLLDTIYQTATKLVASLDKWIAEKRGQA